MACDWDTCVVTWMSCGQVGGVITQQIWGHPNAPNSIPDNYLLIYPCRIMDTFWKSLIYKWEELSKAYWVCHLMNVYFWYEVLTILFIYH